MVSGIWGCKVGMTQIFSKDRVIPVTIVDVDHWVITNIKPKEAGGYKAIQVACVRKRYRNEKFSTSWLKKPKKYFSFIRDIPLKDDGLLEIVVGQSVDFYSEFVKGSKVDVFGRTRGLGFAGVVKRHNFSGSPGGHGHTMGDRTGSIGNKAACGKVAKGKKMPGHLGNQQRVMKNLRIVEVEKNAKALFIKGSIPGKAGTFVFVRKA